MQIIQSLLGIQVQPLGMRKPLGDSHRLLLRRESSYLHGHSSVIKPLGNHLPLVTYSKFSLSHENQAFNEPLLDSNSPEPDYINAELTIIQFNTLDSIVEDRNQYFHEKIQGDVPNILPTQSPSNTNNIKAKSKSKKTDNSSSAQAKSKVKSRKKNVNNNVDESSVVNSSQKITLPTPDEPSVEVANFENAQATNLQSNLALDNHLNNENAISLNPINSLINSPIIEDGSILVKNLASDEIQETSDSPSTVPSADSVKIVLAGNIAESMMLSLQNTALEASVTDSVRSSSVEPPVTNTGDIFTLLNNLNNSEQTVVQEAPQAVDISDILINRNSQQQEVATNPNILRQQEVFSPQQHEDLSPTSIDFAGISDFATDLISNSLPESSNSLSVTTQAKVEETPHLFHDLANVSEIPSAVTTSTESLIPINALDATITTPEITSGEITANVTVQLAPTSPVITDNAIVASQLHSTESVNFVDASENATPVQTDNASNIAVQLAPTSAVIVDNPILASQLQSAESVNLGDALENVTPVHTNGVKPVELSPTSPVIVDNPVVASQLQSAESVNLGDASENVTPVHIDSTSNTPVQLAPTSPVIADNLIFASELQSGESESVTSIQLDGVNNIPVQLTPTSPVIADNLIVASELQSGESDNFVDASKSVVLSPDRSQPNIDSQAVVTPPITQLDESAMSDDKPLHVYASVTSPDFTATQPNFPAPQGFATGGQVTHTSVENSQIAASDTVPAMLTPGEFVINANDTQKNLHILRHINTGGTPEDIILPSLELPTPETPTKVDSFPDTSLQRQKSDSPTSEESHLLIPTSLGIEISQHRRSSPSFLQFNTVENQATARTEPSPHYSLPSLIFRKQTANTNSPYETPNQWSSVEELLTSFNFNSVESNWQNPEYPPVSQSSASPQIFTKRQISPQSFANGGEITAPDIATDIQPITETVESPSANTTEGDESANLEALAYEIYNRLRQRIEVERERQGIYHGRLPW